MTRASMAAEIADAAAMIRNAPGGPERTYANPPKRGTYGQGHLLDAGKQRLKPLLATRLADGRDHALRAWKIERFGHAEHGGRSNEKPKRHALKERSRNSKGEQCGSYGGCTHGDMLASSSVGYHTPRK